MEKCLNCNRETEKEKGTSIRINDDNGFCQSSKSEFICYECYDKNSKFAKPGQFLKLKIGLLFNDRRKYYFDNVFDVVRSKRQLDYIFNRDYYDLLKWIN